MNNNITPEMLIRYLDNELDASQRQLIESQLPTDPGLQQQLERLQLAKQAFTQFARRQQVSSIHAEMMRDLPSAQAKPVAPVRYLRATMRIAALLLVLILIAGVVQYSLLDADRLYRSHYDAYTLGTTRDNTNIPPLEQAYRRNDMQQVIALYESSADSRQPADHFLAGQAYLAIDNPQKAITAFEAQLQANESRTPKPYQDDAEYYLALAWVKSGRADKALPLFQQIHDQKAHAYNREVSSWYLMQLRWLLRKEGK
jgi:tetratricopeptide (TPR) repeat protein